MQRIAILGGGRIGEALLSGLLSSDWSDIVVTARSETRVAELRERHGVEATTSNRDAVAGAALVVVAVKPQDIDALLEDIGALALDRSDGALGRRGDPDGVHRGADRRRRPGRARDAERAVGRARGHGRHRRGRRTQATSSSRSRRRC